MKIIDAYWEKRNIGVSCNEVIVEDSDNEVALREISSLRSNYQVVKLPPSQTQLIIPLQRIGFSFIELIYWCSHNLSLPVLDGPLARMAKEFEILEANQADLDCVKINIERGMFSTDRVALDPRFGVRDSANRYIGWLDDLLKAGAKVFVLKYKKNLVGFYVIRQAGSHCDALIGGVFEDYARSGFGFMLNYFEIVTALEFGAKELRGAFSSNNGAVFGINSRLGYRIFPKFYVFVKHLAMD